MPDGTRDALLYRCVSQAVEEARQLVRERLAGDGWIPRYYKFPKISLFESGWPRITREESDVPNYSRLFGAAAGELTPFGYDDVPSLKGVFDHVADNDALRDALRMTDQPIAPDLEQRMLVTRGAIVVFTILDRALHLHGLDFTEDHLRRVYEQHEASLIGEHLPIDIVVPVAMTPFETKTAVELAPGVSLERMTEEFQLARMPHSQHGPGTAANPVVVGAATHALVFSGYKMPDLRDGRGPRWDLFSFYPLERVELFFTALRLETGLPTGFAQICIRPLGWASSWVAYLPALISGATGRRYPSWFDNWGWLTEPPPAIPNDAVKRVGELAGQIESGPPNLGLSGRRLSTAMLRERDDDSIVDLCIGLEAALGDQQRTEMTHKLALRAAAVLAASDGADAVHVFKDIKAIYAYRSKVVHGADPTKQNTVGAGADARPAVDAAREYLRSVLCVLLRNPAWRKPENIDKLLILGSSPTAACGRDVDAGQQS